MKELKLVLSIVTDGDAVKAIATGNDGIIKNLDKNAAYMDMSTISPDVSREIAMELKENCKFQLKLCSTHPYSF